MGSGPEKIPEARGIAWLHFSDLHAGCRGERDLAPQLMEELARDLRQMSGVVGAPDLILFTGDLANKGTEYELVNAFLDRVRGWLEDAGVARQPLLFAVPGNHDVARPSGLHARACRILRDLDHRDDREVQALWAELWERRDLELIAPLFERYAAWAAEHVVAPLAGDARCTMHGSFFPGDVSAVFTKGPLRLGLVGLNSAWVQYAKGDFEQLLHVPAAQLHAALPDDHDPLAFFRDVTDAFLLMHHPPSWLSPPALDAFHAEVYPAPGPSLGNPPDERFALCLFGHMHAARSEVVAVSGAGPRRLFQAPSIFGLEHYGTARETRVFGYAWGRLEPDGAIRSWPRVRVRRGGGHHAFDRDQRFDSDIHGAVVLRGPTRAAPDPDDDPGPPGDGQNLPGGDGPSDDRRDGRAVRPPDIDSPTDDTDADPADAVTDAELAAYLAWARTATEFLHSVGVGARGDLQLRLDEVYVPLHFQARGLLAGAGPRDSEENAPEGVADDELAGDLAHHRDGVRLADTRIALDRVFSQLPGDRDVFILGEPGSGKTTALQKLMWTVVAPSASGPGESGEPGEPGEPAAAALDATRIGLPRATVPVFARLRYLTPALCQEPIARFLDDELARQAGRDGHPEATPPGLAARLLARGHVLLLLDGLDEIADPARRRTVCGYLCRQLKKLRTSRPGIRAVVSSRRSGERPDITLDASFARLEVQSLDTGQRAALVRHWFEEARAATARSGGVGGRDPRDLEARARRAGRAEADALLAEIEHAEWAQELAFRAIIANPLLLALLCVVVADRGDIPRRRVDFFQDCLDTLLRRRDPEFGTARRPTPNHALDLLRPVAWKLHTEGRKYDLTIDELRAVLQPGMRRLDRDFPKARLTLGTVLRWLENTAGVLEEHADGEYGFAHLKFQEYLAACHVAREGGAARDPLAAGFGDGWWEEVILLYVALPDHDGFGPFMRAVLTTDALIQPDNEQLFRACIDQAYSPDLTPFIDVAEDPGADLARRRVALELVVNKLDARLLYAAAKIMSESRTADLGALPDYAREIEHGAAHSAAMRTPGDREMGDSHEAGMSPDRAAEPDERAGAVEVFLCHNSDDKPAVRRVHAALRGVPGVVPWIDEEDLRPGQMWQEDIERVIARAGAAAVFVGPTGLGPWERPEMRACLSELVRRGMPVIPVLLPGAPGEPALPLFLRELMWVDLRDGIGHGVDDAGIARLVWGITGVKPDALAGAVADGTAERAAADSAPVEPTRRRAIAGHSFVEPAGAIEMLWIPGGRFRMGIEQPLPGWEKYDAWAQPVHAVEVSPFWLGRTAVTNAQYERFVRQTGHPEPSSWNDRRLNQPEQPVVAVTWHDAVAYCAWLTETSGMGVVYRLPTEAEWEFAARGTDGRVFPWGNEEPDPDRADFNRDYRKEGPAPVGSKPAGRGPFGTLDQAGNVWEWCKDVWNERAYAERVNTYGQREAPDPEVVEGDEGRRVCRGGSFANQAGPLRAAYRFRHDAAVRLDLLGFRLSARPASTLLDP